MGAWPKAACRWRLHHCQNCIDFTCIWLSVLVWAFWSCSVLWLLEQPLPKQSRCVPKPSHFQCCTRFSSSWHSCVSPDNVYAMLMCCTSTGMHRGWSTCLLYTHVVNVTVLHTSIRYIHIDIIACKIYMLPSNGVSGMRLVTWWSWCQKRHPLYTDNAMQGLMWTSLKEREFDVWSDLSQHCFPEQQSMSSR